MRLITDSHWLELRDAVQPIFDKIARSPTYRCQDPPIALDVLAEEVKACLFTAVDYALCRYRTTTARHALPPELWYNIWQHCAIRDRTRLTRVCKDWHLALSTSARFWQHVDVTKYIYVRREWPELLPRLLARSKPLPLYLRLEHVDPLSTSVIASELAKVIKPHAHRVVELRLRADKHIFVREFLGDIRSKLTAVRTLVVEEHPALRRIPWLSTKFHAPALERLEISRGFEWNSAYAILDKPYSMNNVFSNVTRLRMGLRTVYQLQSALITCPQLEKLEVHMTDNDVSGDDATLNQAATRVLNQLDTMRAHIATSGFVEWLARAVGTEGPRESIVHVRDDQANRSSFSFDILKCLEGPLRISCRLPDDSLCITARDAANRYIRSVTFTVEARERILSQLAAALTNDCDVLELDPTTFKVARAVHWAVQVRTSGCEMNEDRVDSSRWIA